MNYFNLYPGDYLRDTAELSMEQHGAYLLLMAAYYSTENGIPVEKEAIFRVTRAVKRSEKEAACHIISTFFYNDGNGRYRSKRIEQEIEEAHVRIGSARENGRRGGRPRKVKSETQQKPSGFPYANPVANPTRNPIDNPNVTQEKAHQHQHQEETSRAERDMREGMTSAGEAALAMRRAGCVSINQSNPDFIEAIREGVTAKEFSDAVEASSSAASGMGLFKYAVKVARSNHASAASVITPRPQGRAGPANGVPATKTGEAVMKLQGIINGNQLDRNRDSEGLAGPVVLELGPPARS